MKNMLHGRQQKGIPSNFPLLSCSGKNFKMPWKSKVKLREFTLSKMWPSCLNVGITEASGTFDTFGTENAYTPRHTNHNQYL